MPSRQKQPPRFQDRLPSSIYNHVSSFHPHNRFAPNSGHPNFNSPVSDRDGISPVHRHHQELLMQTHTRRASKEQNVILQRAKSAKSNIRTGLSLAQTDITRPQTPSVTQTTVDRAPQPKQEYLTNSPLSPSAKSNATQSTGSLPRSNDSPTPTYAATYATVFDRISCLKMPLLSFSAHGHMSPVSAVTNRHHLTTMSPTTRSTNTNTHSFPGFSSPHSPKSGADPLDGPFLFSNLPGAFSRPTTGIPVADEDFPGMTGSEVCECFDTCR